MLLQVVQHSFESRQVAVNICKNSQTVSAQFEFLPGYGLINLENNDPNNVLSIQRFDRQFYLEKLKQNISRVQIQEYAEASGQRPLRNGCRGQYKAKLEARIIPGWAEV
jgi:hypothetical protein